MARRHSYDANGNQTLRRIAPYTHTLNYDAQGRMVGVSAVHDPITNTITDTSRLTHTVFLPMVTNGATAVVTSAAFLYDADGTRVKGEVGGVTTIYIAGMYEWQAGATATCTSGWRISSLTIAFDESRLVTFLVTRLAS